LSFEKDLVYRRWAEIYEGFYVVTSENIMPNPYLSHIPERDKITSSGLSLTLVNPCCMTRQVHELGKEQYEIIGNITSLKPLRTENVPDKWEEHALKSFIDGAKEAVIIMKIDGKPYMRLMKPFFTKKSCLKCHGHQGYKVGDIHGGISESTPMSSYFVHIKFQQNVLLAGHGLIWLAGLFFIGIMTSRIIGIRKAGETERKLAEEKRLEMQREFFYSQKRKSLGVLAGGIAHDFNNLLAAIIGNLDLSLLKLSSDSAAKESIENAIKSSQRAAAITRQMLTYSGKAHFVISDININELIRENLKMLNSSISKNININLSLTEKLPLISADRWEIEQIMIHLLTNASEAIGDNEGNITISTGIIDCGENYFKDNYIQENFVPGKYVFFQITDTGCGMDETTKENLFEPFFTTKFTGRGLEMAAVIGIIRSHKGAIFVDSEPWQGTRIKVMFPVS
jgi:signal transduction histidine kinase